MTRLLVQGASGRLGQTIVRLARQCDTWQVTAPEKGASLEPLVAITEVGIDVSVRRRGQRNGEGDDRNDSSSLHGWLAPTDEDFCRRWGRSVGEVAKIISRSVAH